MKTILLGLLLFAVLPVCGQVSSLIPYRKGELWGFSDISGQIVIEAKFHRTYPFSSDGLALIRSGNLYGYVDIKGRMVIIPRYTKASEFFLGIAEVEEKGKKYCINMEGQRDECNPLPDDQGFNEEPVVMFNAIQDSIGGYSLIVNNTGDTIRGSFSRIETISRYFFPIINHFALVSKNNKWGAYNEYGVLVAPLEFEKVDILDLKSYKARVNKSWGVRGLDHKQLLPYEYDSITKVTSVHSDNEGIIRKEHYVVGRNGKYGVLDDKARVVLPMEFDEIRVPSACNCAAEYIVRKGNVFGIADDNGKLLIAIKYAGIEPFNGRSTTLVKTTSGKEGYISREGFEYFRE